VQNGIIADIYSDGEKMPFRKLSEQEFHEETGY
jgi:hypothetical protein